MRCKQEIFDNQIMALTGQPVGRRFLPRVLAGKEELMSDFELLMIALTIALLIVAIIGLQNK